MRILELFSGTKSIGKAFERLSHEVVSVDLDPTFEPTLIVDVLTWDYTEFEPGIFDFVHASPPCTHYSVARTRGGPRDLAGADALVNKVLEIIDYFHPTFWLIENPATGLLKTRPCIQCLPPPLTCSYCMYCAWGYRKNTHFWTNLCLDLKTCDKACPGYENGRHPNIAQRMTKFIDSVNRSNRLADLYRIPDDLCDVVARAVVDGVVV